MASGTATPPPSAGVPPIRTRRLPRCGGCALPPPLCLCAELSAVPVRTRLVLLMNRAEQHKPSNTGRLLARVLPGSEIRVRGLQGASPPPLPDGRRIVLFPDPSAPELTPELLGGGPLVLLVPDGTWRQARRLYRYDADARSAEVVRLPPGAPCRYGLRRNQRDGGLSTFEAVARALGVLEGAAIEARLLGVFERFVERSLLVRRHGERVAAQCARPPG